MSPPPPAPRPPKLLDQLRHACRVRHLSPRTEDAYHDWCRRFILFHGKRHPQDMSEQQVNAFLTHLAVNGRVAASTQNQALCALLFLYGSVLDRPLNRLTVVRATRPERCPVVLDRAEVRALLAGLTGTPALVGQLLYGTGMRVFECLQLRVHDADFLRHEILVRDGKGRKDRVTPLPRLAATALRDHLAAVREQHTRDRDRGLGRVPLPNALARKYPAADREWGWQWVFPATSHYVDRVTGVRHRHHLHETVIQRAFRAAVASAGLTKAATPHTLRKASA